MLEILLREANGAAMLSPQVSNKVFADYYRALEMNTGCIGPHLIGDFGIIPPYKMGQDKDLDAGILSDAARAVDGIGVIEPKNTKKRILDCSERIKGVRIIACEESFVHPLFP